MNVMFATWKEKIWLGSLIKCVMHNVKIITMYLTRTKCLEYWLIVFTADIFLSHIHADVLLLVFVSCFTRPSFPTCPILKRGDFINRNQNNAKMRATRNDWGKINWKTERKKRTRAKAEMSEREIDASTSFSCGICLIFSSLNRLIASAHLIPNRAYLTQSFDV